MEPVKGDQISRLGQRLKYNAVVDKSTRQVDNNGVICGCLISGKRSTAEHSQASATANDAVNPPLNVAKQDQSAVKLKPSACRRFIFLSEKLVITDIPTQGTSETESELERYVAECRMNYQRVGIGLVANAKKRFHTSLTICIRHGLCTSIGGIL